MDIKQELLKLLERRVFNAEELVEEIDKLYKQDQALQLQQTGVMRSACKHDEKNDTKAYAKNGNEFIGYYCEKCDTVYCGSI